MKNLLFPALLALALLGCGRTANRYSAARYSPPFAAEQAAPAQDEAEKPIAPGDTAFNTENYDLIVENPFVQTTDAPVSTFSIDVDPAAYSNIRRFLRQGSLPPKDAVRIEEMINYFPYDYAEPRGEHPFEFVTELHPCPWEPKNKLLAIGLQAKKIEAAQLPPSNLVFLLDVSGSMNAPNKLPLLQQSMNLLVEQLRPHDRVAIVVYAGAAGLVLPSTPGTEKNKIRAAIQELEAGGSTAGGAGIELAYQVATENFQKGGNNRVILATDGDFNVGVSSEGALVRLIEKKRETGVFLTVLGFGDGNYQDAKMQQLADKGNGNHAYIDQLAEARKVLIREFGGTLFTLAKDVKLQLEFNPAHVRGYRLIGYENRLLNREDFDDDTKDAGELGAGHTVTALYEIIPAGTDSPHLATTAPLKYQQTAPTAASASGEWLTLKLRYKQPDGDQSRLLERPVMGESAGAPSENFRWAAAVAEFGLLLRDSKYKGQSTYAHLRAQADAARGKDPHGYRAECLELIGLAEKAAPPR